MSLGDYADVKRDRAGEWRYYVYGANYEALFNSEGYTRRSSAVRALKRSGILVGKIRLWKRDGSDIARTEFGPRGG